MVILLSRRVKMVKMVKSWKEEEQKTDWNERFY
jgi:hypothetical protein